MVPFSFANEEWRLLRSGALFWPRENALLLADLHLEKGSFFARFGQMIPPYDSRETLERVALALKETAARRVYCLGDSFHDSAGTERLEPHAAGMLAALTRVADWMWITGNHDEGLLPHHGGAIADEAVVSGVTLRHHARHGETGAELSGHFHPRLRLSVRGRNIVRPCAVASENRLVLPAFGAFTGGMDASDPAILSALQPARRIRALLATREKVAEYPLWAA